VVVQERDEVKWMEKEKIHKEAVAEKKHKKHENHQIE